MLLPGILTGLFPFLSFGTASVSLAWNPGTNGTAASYNVYYGTSSRSYTSQVTSGTNLAAVVSNLADGSTYYFAVTAVDALGNESDFSDEVSYSAPSVNQPPTISTIANQSTLENTATAAIPFTVNDANTGAASVTVSGSSSVTTVVPNANIVFGGSGANRTVTITPAANMTGSSQITIKASDGSLTTSTTFTVTVSQGNTPPTISAIANQTTSAGQATAAIPFTINDAETPASSLTLSATSGNTLVVPNANIVFGGSGANRTVTVTPAAGRSGSAQITISVSDGTLSTSTSFSVTVQQSTNNTPPTISTIASQTGYEGEPTGAIPFTVGDAQTPAGSLTVSATSDNTALAPVANIALGGSGANRTVTITPAAGQTGSANITISVSDGTLGTTSSFLFTVVEATALPSSEISKASYSGLFYESDAVRLQSSGSFNLTVSKGKYSGSLQMASGKYSFSGQFGALCEVTNQLVARKGLTPLTLSFSLEPGSSTNQFAGTVSDGTWTAEMFGSAAVFNTKTNPAPYAGNYTLAIPGQSSPALGDSFGSLKVDGNGKVKFSGVLADGTKVTQSATLSADGTWGLFVPLYSGQGMVIAWISFQSRATDDLHGAINWLKQPNPAQHYYPGGVILDGNAVGSRFAPASVLALNVEVSKLQATGAPGQITSLKVSTKNGTFKGSSWDQASGQKASFQGALLQKSNTGYGFILETNQSAQLELTP
ncbi:MAG TPA: fibronectin type III domain-containing protein [Candidatus Angelobacter sp.]|nr:fibronectin type III domain-containing protein [Candidatus Angelobacter sp.]